ncbi:MAG: CoA-binding protein [Nitrososphaerota archaeon]|nr:CoA-binding protein [Nitrososphaerota archaeon]MDG6930678.1 CoA-binding protein [Nitrososphaerota archaeon]MDG6933056.1 CoA-binding protein [Nitrososphaerota archaeon]MDG6935299.1 CoA-binding protein [Nitrososphaerota archaeon]MDG6944461.1 CoA-binding protein [Nitrososphaerota archaeon]
MDSVDDSKIIEVLTSYRTIACVGFSKDPSKWAHFVPKFLLSVGYNVIPVNPSAESILGRKSYASLHEVPDKIDIVQIFRPSEEVPEIVNESIKRQDVRVIWMQKGIANDGAAQKAEMKGITVIQDRCMYEEYSKLMLKR